MGQYIQLYKYLILYTYRAEVMLHTTFVSNCYHTNHWLVCCRVKFMVLQLKVALLIICLCWCREGLKAVTTVSKVNL